MVVNQDTCAINANVMGHAPGVWIFKRLLNHNHQRQQWGNSAQDPIYVALDDYVGVDLKDVQCFWQNGKCLKNSRTTLVCYIQNTPRVVLWQKCCMTQLSEFM